MTALRYGIFRGQILSFKEFLRNVRGLLIWQKYPILCQRHVDIAIINRDEICIEICRWNISSYLANDIFHREYRIAALQHRITLMKTLDLLPEGARPGCRNVGWLNAIRPSFVFI